MCLRSVSAKFSTKKIVSLGDIRNQFPDGEGKTEHAATHRPVGTGMDTDEALFSALRPLRDSPHERQRTLPRPYPGIAGAGSGLRGQTAAKAPLVCLAPSKSEYMPSNTLFGMPLIDTCPCGELVAATSRDIVFDQLNEVWHRVCSKCLRAEPPQRAN